jgi:hypothetical protein
VRIALPNHLRPRREKVFGDGPRIPLDREAKVRIMHLARALKAKTERGKHYGVLTGKFVDVAHAIGDQHPRAIADHVRRTSRPAAALGVHISGRAAVGARAQSPPHAERIHNRHPRTALEEMLDKTFSRVSFAGTRCRRSRYDRQAINGKLGRKRIPGSIAVTVDDASLSASVSDAALQGLEGIGAPLACGRQRSDLCRIRGEALAAAGRDGGGGSSGL